MRESCPETPRRARQAFVLGWAVTNLGGVNEVIRNLIREFARSGPLAPLVIEAGSPGSSHSLEPDVPVLHMEFLPLYAPARRWKSAFSFCISLLPCLWRLYVACRRYNIEILNPHFVGLQYFVLVLFRRSRLFRGKLLFSFHGSDLRTMMRSKGFERFLYRMLLRGADALVACSEDLGAEVASFVPECAARLTTIHNGIDVDHFLASADSVFSLPESFSTRSKLLNVGAFEHKKAHDVLLRAFARVRAQHRDVCLIIAGQHGPHLPATQDLICELGLQNDVLLLLDVPHSRVAALMQLADMFVLSSRWNKGICGEGFAMVLLEAAAAGRPVISTESCGVSELVKNGKSGIVVPTERSDLLAAAIEFFLDNPGEAARQGHNLHEVVREQFTWTAAHQRYLELAGHPPQPAIEAAPPRNYDLVERTSATTRIAPSRDG